eukprot:scaffold87913_cov42-Tisochrysis_lutea.AAC.1
MFTFGILFTKSPHLYPLAVGREARDEGDRGGGRRKGRITMRGRKKNFLIFSSTTMWAATS